VIGGRSGWVPALRIARREALRHRGRSLLTLVLIGLPVLAVVALDVLLRTATLSSAESADRDLAGAGALVRVIADPGEPVAAVTQQPDGTGWGTTGPATLPAPTTASLRALLPAGSRLLPVRRLNLGVPGSSVAIRTPDGIARADLVATDLAAPLARRLYPLVEGRAPRGAGEVAVSEPLAARGYRPGRALRRAKADPLRVVGVVRDPARTNSPVVIGTAATFPGQPNEWLADVPGGVPWSMVQGLNLHGLVAVSRAVLADPPPVRTQESGGRNVGLAVAALVAAMAVLEVVLLAGPAFAIGNRRQRRSLALVAATGGEPRHLRRVVLSGAVVLGGAAAVTGTVFGVAAAYAALPLLQHLTSSRFGPFEVRPRDLVVIALFGLGSALLAALVPAIAAARTDVVAVLAGRRGATRSSRRWPVLGLLLVAAGVAAAVMSAGLTAQGDFAVALSAVPTVLGCVLLAPVLLAAASRLGHRLPLPLRFAARDAARQRQRTAPAVAAVCATVAGVVALGIGAASDDAQQRATYTPTEPLGLGVVQLGRASSDAVAQLRGVVARDLPTARIRLVRGIPDLTFGSAAARSVEFCPGVVQPAQGCASVSSSSSSFGTTAPVGPGAVDLLGLPAAQAAAARRTLAAGGVVMWLAAPPPGGVVTVRLVDYSGGNARVVSSVTAPALRLPPVGLAPAAGLLSASVAARLGATVRPTALVVDRSAISSDAERRVSEASLALGADSFQVGRGYSGTASRVALTVLSVVGAFLVLGGTLTATFLALGEARPDFATLLAVGGEPGTRRRIAASYAAVIGLLGSLLGVAAGIVPGIAVTFPLTSTTGVASSLNHPVPSHFLVVPWPLLGAVVVGVPLLAAGVVALATRGPLPLTRRDGA